MISFIVAASTNNVIGVDGGLPWHLPEDLKRFKTLTMGKPIVMGRKTWESIGKALPGRRSVVVSSQDGYDAEGAEVFSTIDAALDSCADADEIMVIGGGSLYAALLPRADRIYLTRVASELDGDAYFSELDEAEWKIVSREEFLRDDQHAFDYSIQILERR